MSTGTQEVQSTGRTSSIVCSACFAQLRKVKGLVRIKTSDLSLVIPPGIDTITESGVTFPVSTHGVTLTQLQQIYETLLERTVGGCSCQRRHLTPMTQLTLPLSAG